MFCDTCIYNGKSKQIFPLGSFHPDYYLLGDLSVKQETDTETVYSMSYPSGQYLMNTIYSLGMNNDNTRIFKMVRCSSDKYDEDANTNARNNCSEFALIDIYKTNPKIIIAMGGEPTKLFIKDKFRNITSSRGRIYTVKIKDKEFKVLSTFSPNYIVNNPGQSKTFTDDLMYAKSFVNGDLVDIGQKDIRYARTYDDFKKYYDEYLKDSKMPSFDLETNAEDPRSEAARIVGYSFAADEHSGIYVIRNSLDYKMPDEDYNKIVELSKDIIRNKTILVHNCMYEIPFTYNEWGVYIENFEDTLIKSRLILGGKLGASLKERCIKDLGYPDWDHDLGEYNDSFMCLIHNLRNTPAGKHRWEYDYLSEHGFLGLLDYYDNNDTSKYNKRETSVLNSVLSIRNIVSKYYESDEEYNNVLEKVGIELIALIDSGFNSSVLSYGYVPMRIITKYGAMDSIATQDLNISLDKRIKKNSEDLNIDLTKGYGYMKQHYIVGVWMELNGLYWNDEIATKQRKWYNDTCIHSFMNMINNPLMDDYLINQHSDMIGDYLKQNLDVLFSEFGDFQISDKYIIVDGKGKIKYQDIYWSLSDQFKKDHRQEFLDYIRKVAKEESEKVTNYQDLKWIFNPQSPKQENRDLLDSILVTPQIRIAHLLNVLNVMIDDPSFNINQYPVQDRGPFQVLIDCKNYNKYVDEYNKVLDDDSKDNEVIDELIEPSYGTDQINDSEDQDGQVKKIKLTSIDTYNKFCNVLMRTAPTTKRSGTGFPKEGELRSLIATSNSYKMEKTAEPNMIEINSYYKILGIDIDNPSTWDYEGRYDFLFNFRVWKKCNKMITAYIDGDRVGRGSVWIVDKKGYESGELLTKRKRKYNGIIHDDESAVMQASFKVCTAKSFRWQAGLHCLHPDTEILLVDNRSVKVKDLYKEFKSGKNNYVYSRSESENKLVIELIRDVYISHKTNDMIRIYLDNGKYFEVTPNHRMIIRDGSYKEASELKEGDSLYPINIKLDDTNHNQIFDPDLNEYRPCHYLSDEFNERYGLLRDMSNDYMGANGSWVLHHIDFNPLNNNPDNVNRFGYNTHDLIHKSPEGRRKSWKRIKYRMSTDPEYYNKIMSRMKRNGYYRFVESSDSIKYRRIVDRSHCIKYNSDDNYKIKCMRGRILKSLHDINDNITSDNYDLIREKYKLRKLFTRDTINKYFNSLEEAINLSKDYNHNVVKIERIHYDTPIDVYSIAIKSDSPSFSLSCGVLSHNTIPTGSQIKNIYTSRYPGGTIAAPDFSQMELRCMAGAAQDPNMIDAFRHGADIHRMNASNIFGKPPEEITPAERRYSKMACCLGNTKIKLATGDVTSIEEIYNSGKRDFYLYSFDVDKKKVVPGHAVNVVLTKNIDHVLRVTFDNDKYIDVTEDHKFLTIDGVYKNAKDLESGDCIESLFYRIPLKGGAAYCYSKEHHNYYEQIRDVRYKYYAGDRSGKILHPRYGKWTMTHTEFYKSYYGEFDIDNPNVDHIDHNSLNNDKINLRELSQSDNLVRSLSKSDKDRFELLAQAQNIVLEMMYSEMLLTPSNFDNKMNEMYQGRGHLYWSTVSKYYSMNDVVYSALHRVHNKHIDSSRFDDPVKGKFSLSEIACRKIKSVECIHFDEEVPVYDISVEGYHNYAIDLGDNSGVFTHNSFQILYGGTEPSFAAEFLNGDLALAHKLFSSFYAAYPKVKDYIDAKHEEYKKYGKVTTMMDMFINVDEPDESKCLRFAQNAPIQSAASMLAGLVMSQVKNYIFEHHMKSKIIHFVHDSIEVDIHPAEIFSLGSLIIPLMNKYPNEVWNLPTKADLVFGPSIGQELDIKKIDSNEDFSEGTMELEGFLDDFDQLFNEWKKVYKVAEYEDIDPPQDQYISWSELFIPKKAISSHYGHHRTFIHRKVHIVMGENVKYI